MQIEAMGRPIKYRLSTGEEILLKPGIPVELRDESARILLKQAGDLVRVVSPTPVVIETATENPRPVYWERVNGSIVGPGIPEFMAKVDDGPKDSYWVVAQFAGQPIWVNSIVLRSRRQFEQQIKPKPFERIKEPR